MVIIKICLFSKKVYKKKTICQNVPFWDGNTLKHTRNSEANALFAGLKLFDSQNIPMISPLECKATVLRSICCSDKLIGCTKWINNMIWPGEHYGQVSHECQELVTVGQHELWIKSLNKCNTYLSSMRSVSYLSCRQAIYTYIEGVENLVLSITLIVLMFPW